MHGETVRLEELGLAGHSEELPHSALAPATLAGLDQPRTDSLATLIGMHGQAAHFGQPPRIHLQGAAANDHPTVLGDKERRDARKIQLNQLVGEERDQVADLRHLSGPCGSNSNHALRQSA